MRVGMTSMVAAVVFVATTASAGPSEPPAPLFWDITAKTQGYYPRIRSLPAGVTDVYFTTGTSSDDVRWDVGHALEYSVPPGPTGYTKIGNAFEDYLVSEQLLYHFPTNTTRPMTASGLSIHRDVAIWSNGSQLEYENVVSGASGTLTGLAGPSVGSVSNWETWVAYTYDAGGVVGIGIQHIPTDTSLPGPYVHADSYHPHLSLGKLVYELPAKDVLIWEYMGLPWTEQKVPLAKNCTDYRYPKIGGRWGQLVAYQADCGGRYLFVANLDNGKVYFVDGINTSNDVGFDIQLERLTYSDPAGVVHLIRLDELSM